MKNKDQILLEAEMDKVLNPKAEGLKKFAQHYNKTLSFTLDEVNVLFELLNVMDNDMIPPISVEDDDGNEMDEEEIAQIINSIYKKLSEA